ncbi:6-bladed beta-propeller [Capnocytophaga canis]|uniref:6-bladed beta-propeller n=1 Tax=Capnocytophaga canis TaxID=1848903 RepID=A0A0B7IKY5_9FLAO|nr:6-bladed beta-propeller [Capnocytophaga canis]CEN50657.1 conserved exported hypothetical protein [Capnocytophaga canis]
MKTTQILIGMVMLLIACSDSKTQSNQGTKSTSSLEKIIDLEKAIENPIEPLNLSDFVEDIEYIRPEYPASLVDIIFDVALDENYLLLQVRERLLCYSRDGKFLREISRKGQGPKEHLGIRAFSMRDNLIGIHSNFSRKVLWYNPDNEYLGETPIADKVSAINILDRDRIVIHYPPGTTFVEDPVLYIAGVINSKGDTIQLKKSKPYYSKGRTSRQSIWNYKDVVRVLTCVNDTIYSVSKDEITPAYVVNFGKYKVSQEHFSDIKLEKSERGQKFIQHLSFSEMPTKMFLRFVYDQKKWYGVYDKQTGETSVWSVAPDDIDEYGILKGGGWVNDVDGGWSPLHFDSNSDGYFIGIVPPEELKARFLEDKERIEVKYPEKQKKLEQFVNSLDDDENPIIIIYKLKK